MTMASWAAPAVHRELKATSAPVGPGQLDASADIAVEMSRATVIPGRVPVLLLGIAFHRGQGLSAPVGDLERSSFLGDRAGEGLLGGGGWLGTGRWRSGGAMVNPARS
jgi:hypothetical protein